MGSLSGLFEMAGGGAVVLLAYMLAAGEGAADTSVSEHTMVDQERMRIVRSNPFSGSDSGL